MIALPLDPNANERLLAGWEIERHTGLTTTALTLNRPCYGSLALVAKNGSIVDPSTLTIDGTSVTLGSAAIAGDVFVVLYLARSN